MKKFAKIALGAIAVGTAVHLIVHRKVVTAVIKGDPIPEPPAWHKKWHPYFK